MRQRRAKACSHTEGFWNEFQECFKICLFRRGISPLGGRGRALPKLFMLTGFFPFQTTPAQDSRIPEKVPKMVCTRSPQSQASTCKSTATKRQTAEAGRSSKRDLMVRWISIVGGTTTSAVLGTRAENIGLDSMLFTTWQTSHRVN